jgi:hypothetical protein
MSVEICAKGQDGKLHIFTDQQEARRQARYGVGASRPCRCGVSADGRYVAVDPFQVDQAVCNVCKVCKLKVFD